MAEPQPNWHDDFSGLEDSREALQGRDAALGQGAADRLQQRYTKDGQLDVQGFQGAAPRVQRRLAQAGIESKPLPRISTPEEAEALPPGTDFLGPDGAKRTVPYKVTQPQDLNDVPDGADFTGPDGQLRVKPKYEPIDVTAQYLYNVAHSDKGRKKALERSYPGKVRDDPSGGFFVEDDDGVLRKPGRGAAATGGGIASSTFPVAGGIGGAVGGGLFGGLPGVAGAFAGGAAGSKANDIVASLAGVYDDEGATKDALIEGGLAAGGQVAGKAIGAGARVIGDSISGVKNALPGFANKMLGTNPEKLRAAIPLAEAGSTEGEGLAGKLGFRKAGTEVPPSQLFPESPALQNMVEFKEQALHTQDPLRMSREAHYERSVGDILEGVGIGKPMSRTEIDRTFKEMVSAQEAGNTPLVEKLEDVLSKANARSATHPDAAVSVEGAGERILESIRAKSAASDQRLKDLLELRKADATRRAEVGSQAHATQATEVRAANEAAQRDAQALLDQGYADLNRQSTDALRVAHAGHNTGDLWRSIAEQINQYRAGFQARSRMMYDTADELSGATFNRDTGQWMGGATVNTSRLSRQASAFLQELPEGFEAQNPTIVRRMRDLAGVYDDAAGEWIKEPAVTTWSQLRDLRTQLRQSINWQNLTPNVREGTYKYFNNRVDEIIKDANNPATREAAAALSKADAFYRENIRVLEDKQLQTLANGMKSGMQSDPKVLLHEIMKSGKTEVAKQIESIVGPNTWNALRATDVQEMLSASRTHLGDIDGKIFSREVLKRDRQGLLETLHGPGANRLRDQAIRVDQLEGRLPIRTQPGDTANDIISRARAAAEAAKEAGEKDPLKLLPQEMGKIIRQHKEDVKAAGPTNAVLAMDPTIGAHAAVDKILSSPDMLVAAGRAFPGGENSPEFKLIRQVYAQRFLQRSSTNLRPAKQFKEKEMTPEIQQLMFPGVTLKQMHLLAKEMELLIPKGGDGGKGIMKTNIQEHPLGQFTGLGKLAAPLTKAAGPFGINMGARKVLGDFYAFVRHVSTSPTTLRWLEKGLSSSDPAARAATRAELSKFFQQSGAIGGGAAAGLGAAGPGAPDNE